MVGGKILGSIRKKAEQASKQHPSMASESAPASRFQPAWVPVLISFDYGGCLITAVETEGTRSTDLPPWHLPRSASL